MSERTFTLREAEALLPILESLLKRSMEGKKQVEEIDEEFKALAARVFALGGAFLNVKHWAARKAAKEKALQQVRDAVAEIHATGVQVKDLDIGLLDFPCVVDGEQILLCWKLGEPRIAHWHGLEEGFRGRKPIDDRILRASKEKHPS